MSGKWTVGPRAKGGTKRSRDGDSQFARSMEQDVRRSVAQCMSVSEMCATHCS